MDTQASTSAVRAADRRWKSAFEVVRSEADHLHLSAKVLATKIDQRRRPDYLESFGLANNTTVSTSTFQKYFSGERIPTAPMDLLRRIALVFAEEAPALGNIFDRQQAYLSRILRGSGRSHALKIEDVSFVERMGWTHLEFLRRLRELDFELLRDELGDENEASPADLVQVFMDHPDTWRLLVVDDQEVVGYWHFDPVNPETYERARSGNLFDRELTMDALSSFSSLDKYDIYIAFFGIKAIYKMEGLHQLYFSFLNVVRTLAVGKVYIGRICANGLSKSGRKLCSELGMVPKGAHKRGNGHIFEDTMLDLLARQIARRPNIYGQYRDLLRLYLIESKMARAK